MLKPLNQPEFSLVKKTHIYFILPLLLFSFLSFGQNIHDPYLNVNGLPTTSYQATGTQYPSGGYMGEYQFYLPFDHPWIVI